MEGERIAKSLGIYHEKYRALVKKQRREAAAAAAADANIVAETAAATTATTTAAAAAPAPRGGAANGAGGASSSTATAADDRKKSVEPVKKVGNSELLQKNICVINRVSNFMLFFYLADVYKLSMHKHDQRLQENNHGWTSPFSLPFTFPHTMAPRDYLFSQREGGTERTNNSSRLSLSHRQFVPARRTDGDPVPPHLLNDYTSERVREEQTTFEADKDVRSLPTVPLCPGCHGGESDNPKGKSEEILFCVLQEHV